MGNVGSVSLEAISTPPTAVVCTGKEAVEVQSTHTHTHPQQTALTALTANVQTSPVQNRVFLSGYFLSLISITESKKRDDTELFPTNNPKADWTVLRCYCRLFVVRLPKNKNLIRVKFKLFIFGKTPVTDIENVHILKVRRDWEL